MTIHAPGGSFLTTETDFDSVFTPEQFSAEARMMAATADEFLRKELLPRTDEIESHDTGLMRRLMEKAGELGLLGAEIPTVYGGLGLDNRTGALLAEKLNWQQSFALTHEAHTVIGTLPLLYFGSHEQKLRYLPKLASGEWVAAFALSETGSGSDALAAQTRATLSADGSYYQLKGEKMWITNTAFADLFTVFAKIDGTQFTPFLVERTYPGLSFGKEEQKLGMRGTSTRRVILDNVRVPAENRIGEPGKGHRAAFCALNMGRFKLEAGAVGGIKEILGRCTAYAKQRSQFGKPLFEFPLIQRKLADMSAALFGLESAVYRLAGLLDGVFDTVQPESADAATQYHAAAEEYAIECNIVKVFGSELYSWAADEGIQIHGGNGYTEEFAMARTWRDQRLLRIGEGANEIVRVAIAANILRRADQGRLQLGSADGSSPSCRADAPSSADAVPGSADARSAADKLIPKLKSAAITLLLAARAQYGADLPSAQDVQAAVADLAVAAYVLESAVLRTEWIKAHGTSARAEAAAAATALLADRLRSQALTALEYAGPCVTDGAAQLGIDLRLVCGKFRTIEFNNVTGREPLITAIEVGNGYPF